MATKDTIERPTKRAILIGIDKYNHEPKAPTGKRFNTEKKEMKPPKDLNGCVNDVLAVRDFLIKSMEMGRDNIQMLLAPGNRGTGHAKIPPNLKNKDPTYENIVQALAEVPKYAKKNDSMYIHYSGHGGQATTVFAELKKSGDTIDHSLLPTDLFFGGQHLRDVELGALLQDIVEAGVVLTVVLDCCHSGGAIRGDDDDDSDLEGVRGDDRMYQSDPLVDIPLSKGRIDHWGNTSQWMEAPKGFVVLAACLDHQKAKETTQNELYHGRLTFWLLDTVRSSPLSFSTGIIYDRVRAKIQNSTNDQTPYVIGDDDRFFFGPQYRSKVYALPVKDVHPKKQEITLGGGLYHGVKEKAEYAILPLLSDLSKPIQVPDILARVRVQHVEPFTSNTALISDEDREQNPRPRFENISEGCPAVLQSLPLDGRATVRFLGNEQQWSQFKQGWDRENTDRTGANSLIRLLQGPGGDSSESALLNVSVDTEGLFQLADGPGFFSNTIARTLNPLRHDSQDSMASLIGRLEHIARYHLLRGLENPGLLSGDLSAMITVKVQPAPEAVDGLYPVDEMVCDEGVYDVQERRLFQVTIKNKSNFKVGCTILDFSPEFGIEIVSPSDGTSPYSTIHPGKELEEILGVSIPAKLREPAEKGEKFKDIFKIMVSRPEEDVGSLRLMKLGEKEESKDRGDDPTDTLGSLDDLLAKLRPVTRDGFNVRAKKVVEWQTMDIVIRCGCELSL